MKRTRSTSVVTASGKRPRVGSVAWRKMFPERAARLDVRRRKRRARSYTASGFTSNPPIAQDFTNVLLPGFAAYGATRVLQRIVYTLVQRRWPRLGRHAHAASGLLSFGGVWWMGHRIKRLEGYHDAVVMGSGIAALQGLWNAYMHPKYSWLLADPKATDISAKPEQPPVAQQQSEPEAVEGRDEYSYLEDQLDQLERSGSRRARSIPAPKPASRPIAAAMGLAAGDGKADMDTDLMAELGDEDVDDFYSGPFSN